VENAVAELSGLKSDKVDNFVEYLGKHRARIPDYQLYQELGFDIGPGSVESKIKQMENRVKITRAQWKPENIPQILRFEVCLSQWRYFSKYLCLV
jgi:hypothetical protein